MSVPGFPNLFLLYGPNTNGGTGSVIYTIEAGVQHVIEAVHAGDDEAVPLGVGTGTMVLRADSVTYDQDDAAVEFSRVLYRVERFRFSLESYRLDDRVIHFPSSGATGSGPANE